MARKLPTFIISGRPQAGKSTILTQLLQYTTPEKTGIIGHNSTQTGRIIPQTTKPSPHHHAPGCACCSPRQDLPEKVQSLLQHTNYDYLLIEIPANQDTATIAESLVYEQDNVDIFAIITVVDASKFFNILRDQDDSDNSALAESLILDIEFADIIIINKTDLVDTDTLDSINQHVKILNQSAQILPTTFGSNLPNTLLTQNVFDLEATTRRAGWIHTLENPTSEFTFRARRPFHPQRFMDSIERGWPGVFRSKGTIWLATREDIAGEWSQTGNSCALEPAGYWFAALDQNKWPDDPETQSWITENWDEQTGDRRQEIAFLGIDIDLKNLFNSLNACLLTDEEMNFSTTKRNQLPDPFPQWELGND